MSPLLNAEVADLNVAGAIGRTVVIDNLDDRVIVFVERRRVGLFSYPSGNRNDRTRSHLQPRRAQSPCFFEALVGFIAADGRVAGLVVIVVGLLINICFARHPDAAAIAMVQARRDEDGEASQSSSGVPALSGGV